jgi:hypothetical protein
MSETAESTGPMAFAANFPPEERFTATAAELAGRLAAACGCAADAAEEIRGAVSRAFGEARALAAAGPSGIDVTLRTDDGAFEADVACGGRAVLHCSRTRSA